MPGADAMRARATFMLAIGLLAMAAAAQPPPASQPPNNPPAAQRDATSAQIAEIEAQIARLSRQLDQLRQHRPADARWNAPPAAAGAPGLPPSPLQRAYAVMPLDAGCPPGAVCLMVRCDAPYWR
jgi:hypothetical protein